MPRWTSQKRIPLEDRFWAKVRKGASCWEWTGSANKKGYGQIYDGTRPRLAHRISWRLHRGEPGPGLFVLHSCDNPRCVRPDHLFLGTHDDNMRDAKAKGRLAGQYNGRAKLTWEQIDEIRGRFVAFKIAIAADFKTKPRYIGEILTGRRWTKVRRGKS